jgi:hypothetical protein
MSWYHPNPESLTEDERRALDEKWRIEQEIDNLHDKPSKRKTVKPRPAEVALHSHSVASDVAAREEVATTVKSVPEFPVASAAAVVAPGAAVVATGVAVVATGVAVVAPGGALEPGSEAAAPVLGLVAEHTPSDEEKKEMFVAILIDCTASMQPHIDATKKAVTDVLKKMQKANPNTVLKVALITYRDFNPFKPILPQEHEAGQYGILDFTDDMTIVYLDLDNVRADGGDDIAENMAGALDKVGKLSWPTEASPHITRKVMIIADAPCHGVAYHDINVSDNFPRGCPLGFDPKSQIAKFARQNIDVIVVRLVKHTLDKMIEVFDTAYQSGRIPGSTADFIVMDAIQQSAPSSSYYRPSLFADEDDDDVDRCSMYVPECEDVGAERSFGCDDDDDSVSRSFTRNFPPSFPPNLGVNRGGSDSDNEDPSFMPAPFMATAAAAANASMPAAKTMDDVFREVFSKHKL